jgi:hypothetical protein
VVDESIGSGRVVRCTASHGILFMIKGFWYMVVLDATAHGSSFQYIRTSLATKCLIGTRATYLSVYHEDSANQLHSSEKHVFQDS